MRRIGGAVALALWAGAVQAHPHVFIDAEVAFHFNAQGQISHLRIRWTYDDFTSMQVLADTGLDVSATLGVGESGALSGFDMRWIEGFEGDSYLQVSGAPVALSGPKDWTTSVQNGVITTEHSREVLGEIPQGPIEASLKIYDPTYYTAYTIAAQPVLTGRADCTVQLFGPDPSEASEILQQALAELSGAYSDEDFPAIGADFAEDLRLSCP